MFANIKPKRQGFTLIELLVVIVVIAVLALICIPRFTDAGRRSKESSMRSDLSQLRSAVATYQTDTGAFPSSLNDLILTAAPSNGISSTGATQAIVASEWHGPYLTGIVPVDPVANTAFTYSVTGNSVGKVSSAAAGNGLDGNPYSGY